MVNHSIGLSISKDPKSKLHEIKSSLLSNSPSPNSGYRTSSTVGKPEDSSSAKVFNSRYNILKQQKEKFKKITKDAELKRKSPRADSAFHLAAAPVAHPGTSKHSSGYALDIKGSAGTIKSISKQSSATLVFDEKSHVHVEFKNG